MARRVALAIPERRDQPGLGFSLKNPHSNRRSSNWAEPTGSTHRQGVAMERWTGSSSAESDTLAPEHSSLDRSNLPRRKP